MFKEQTMIQLQYPKVKATEESATTSSSTHSVVENSAIHYSALFTAHPLCAASSSIRTEGYIPQHKVNQNKPSCKSSTSS
eukprot:gene9228-6481_t